MISGHQPQRRLLQLDRGLGVGELAAPSMISGPVDELAHWLGLKSEFLGESEPGQELGAALGLGVVELLAALLALEVSFSGPRDSGKPLT